MDQRCRQIVPPMRGAAILAAIALFALIVPSGPPSALAADKSMLLTEVHFDPGSVQVTPGGEQKIRQAIAAIKERSPAKLHIVGFTDSTGDEAVNRRIAHHRAENVANLLVKQGIDIPLVVEGRGEKGAPYKIADDVSEPLNRCVGIIAINPSEGVEPLL